MRFELMDYSRDYFDKLPPERGGKFIQVIGGDTHYIIMAPREMCTFHANIAKRFFDSLGIRGRYNHKSDNYTLTHPDWALPGGGHWELNEKDRTLTLSGQ